MLHQALQALSMLAFINSDQDVALLSFLHHVFCHLTLHTESTLAVSISAQVAAQATTAKKDSGHISLGGGMF